MVAQNLTERRRAGTAAADDEHRPDQGARARQQLRRQAQQAARRSDGSRSHARPLLGEARRASLRAAPTNLGGLITLSRARISMPSNKTSSTAILEKR